MDGESGAARAGGVLSDVMSSVTTEGHQEEAVQEGLADRRLSMTARSEWIERRMEVPLVLASLLVIPVIFVGELYPVHPLDYLATVMNWAIWSVFALEVILMLATVPDRKAWLKHHPLELAVVVLTPPFLPPVLQSARLFRLVRLVRLVVSLKHLRRAFTLDGLKYATVVGVFVLLGGGAAFTAVEHGQGLTAWDGMWWAFTTVTTVSYGDVIPKERWWHW